MCGVRRMAGPQRFIVRNLNAFMQELVYTTETLTITPSLTSTKTNYNKKIQKSLTQGNH